MKSVFLRLLAAATILTLSACFQTDTPPPPSEPVEEPAPEPEPEESPNLVQNGEFDTLEGWASYFLETAQGEAELREGELCLDITDGGSDVWQIQVVQSELGLEVGTTYTTRFDAKADQSLQMRVLLEEEGDDYTALAGETFELTDALTSYEFTGTVEEAADSNRIILSTGGDLVSTTPVTLCLDNIEVRAQAASTDE